MVKQLGKTINVDVKNDRLGYRVVGDMWLICARCLFLVVKNDRGCTGREV